MIHAYFDASGKPHQHRAVTVGGFVGPGERWDLFAQIWNEQLIEAGVPYYHASELESLRGIYEKRGWTHDDKVRFQISFISCFEVVQPWWGLSCGITIREFKTNADLPGLIETPYALCALWCVLAVLERAKEQGWSEPIQFVFDEGDQGAAELHRIWPLLQDGQPLLQPVRFADDRTFLGLQAADFHAYESWKQLENHHLAGKPFDLEAARKSLRSAFSACAEMECWLLDGDSYQPLVEELRKLRTRVGRMRRE